MAAEPTLSTLAQMATEAAPDTQEESSMSAQARTKEQMRQFVAADKGSVFAPSVNGNGNGSPIPSNASDASSASSGHRPTAEQMDKMSMENCEDDDCNEFPRCKGLQLPKTQKSEKNVEVMRAWRTIRTDPNFKVRTVFHSCTTIPLLTSY